MVAGIALSPARIDLAVTNCQLSVSNCDLPVSNCVPAGASGDLAVSKRGLSGLGWMLAGAK